MQATLEAGFTVSPFIYTLEILEGMNKGEPLQVITNCPGTFRNGQEYVLHIDA